MIVRKTALGGASALALLTGITAVAQVQLQADVPAAGTPAAAAAEPVTTQATDDIVVTGSRIPTNGFKAPTPVTVTSAAQLNSASPSTLGDALRLLLALTASVGPRGAQQSSGQGGAYLNLRNLGYRRSLPWLGDGANGSVRVLGTYTDRYIQRSPGVVAIDRAGQAGIAAHWHVTGQTQIDVAPLLLFFQGRYIGDGAYDKTTLAADLPQKHIRAQVLFDPRIGAQLPVPGDAEGYIAVSNVFNTLIDAYQSNGPAGVADFDSVGQTFHLGIRFKY